MGQKLRKLSDFIYRVTASKKFFAAILLLFVAQGSWLAFTAIYPMPFDEYAHVGAIQLYAKQWSWVVTSQPIDTGIIGDLTREPSFLYRWLMSFPYRIFDTFLSTEQTIIAMRLINVAMVAGGIVLFRRLLREWKLSERLVNIVLLAFIMTPIVPFLAAHVNYDNLMFLLTPIVLSYATRLIKDNKNIVPNATLFVLSGLATVLVKQTFLPIMVITGLYVLAVVFLRNRGKVWPVLVSSWRDTSKNWQFCAVSVAMLLLGAMAVERYGGNIVTYGTYRPKCQAVQPMELCEQFGPWYRDNVVNIQGRPDEPPYGNPLSFSQYWASRMMRGYFAIFQHTPTKVVSEKEPYGPIITRPLLPLPVNLAAVVAVTGVIAVIWQRRTIWRDPNLRFALVLSLGFIVVQWGYNYSSYLKLWKGEAIQARYTYPILVLIFTLIAWALNRTVVARHVKVVMVAAICIFYVWGGGIAGYLIRADDTWRWQHQVTQSVNQKLQTGLRYTVFH